MLQLNGIVLPVKVWAKVEDFGEGRSGSTVGPKAGGLGPNQPGPSGFRSEGARGVRVLVRTAGVASAPFLADRPADRETEPMQFRRSMV